MVWTTRSPFEQSVCACQASFRSSGAVGETILVHRVQLLVKLGSGLSAGRVLLAWDPSPGPGLDPAGGGEPEGGQTPSAPQTNSKAIHCPKSSPHDPEQAPDNINCSHMGFDPKSTGMFRCWLPDPANASSLLRTDPRSPPGTNSEQGGLYLCLWISSRQRLDTNLFVR